MKRILSVSVGVAVLGVLVLWGGGFFTRATIAPGHLGPAPPAPEPTRTAEASREKLPVHYEAVGTVASRVRSEVASQVTARIVELPFEAGERVAAKDVLARLDDRELAARLAQARQAAAAADAERRAAEGSLGAARA
ncbi:MAG: biotin/lipoyl-binding protein, partial [Gemmatimonadetes bacterium]|nr:biotin/lipoyl-binding protein [Gemmatimonadota bacterium]